MLIVLVAVVCGCGTDKHGAEVESYEIDSQAVGRELHSGSSAGGTKRRLLVFLHGRNGDEDSNLNDGSTRRSLTWARMPGFRSASLPLSSC